METSSLRAKKTHNAYTEEQVCLALRRLSDQEAYPNLFSPPFCPDRIALPETQALSELLKKLTNTLYASLKTLGHRPVTPYSKPCWSNLFGPDWEGHPFRHKPLFWWRSPLEPDATRMISRACSALYCGERSNTRIRTFLTALQKAIPESFNLPEFPPQASLTMRAEVPTEQNKRLDLLFEYGEGSQKIPFLVIEAKFGAPLDNQLSLYKEYMQKNCSSLAAPNSFVLVILGSKDNRKPEDILQGWQFAHWTDLLRFWEIELCGDKDQESDFSRLRATLWTKLLEIR